MSGLTCTDLKCFIIIISRHYKFSEARYNNTRKSFKKNKLRKTTQTSFTKSSDVVGQNQNKHFNNKNELPHISKHKYIRINNFAFPCTRIFHGGL